MKISLNMSELKGDGTADQGRAVEAWIAAARQGDFEAKQALFQHYMPLLTSLAKKRSSEVPEVNKYIERGKEGLMAAVHKYKPGKSGEKFKLFALDYIERAMEGETSGFFSRLFGKK